MSEAADGVAPATAVAEAPAESLKRELEDPDQAESALKRAHVVQEETAESAAAGEAAVATAEVTTDAPTTTVDVAVPTTVAPGVAAVGVNPAMEPGLVPIADIIASPEICVRVLMTNKMVGMVIGKGGEKIRRVRETSGCQITFSDNHPGVQDRVLMVTGPYDHVKAAMSVIVMQLEQDTIIANTTTPSPTGNQLLLKLLVPQSQIGAVIGKGGSNLEKMRASTGAQIIAAAEVLPNSTDRPVSLSGPGSAIVACIENAMEVFQTTPLGTQQIQYRPPAPQQYAGYGPQRGYGQQPMGAYGAPGPHGYPAQGPHGYGMPAAQPQAPQTMQQFTIANDLVGCVIGRGGSEINNMRKQSGANIRIHQAENGQVERLVSVSGTQEQVAMAHYLLTQKLQQEVSNNWAPGSGAAPAQQQQAPAQQAYY